MTNTGLQSGLDTDVSDYVARVSLQTNRNLLLVHRYRFDKDTMAVRRFELEASAGFGPVSLSTILLATTRSRSSDTSSSATGIFQNASIECIQIGPSAAACVTTSRAKRSISACYR